MLTEISVDSDRIAEFRQRNQILRLAFFGSVLRDDFSADSDVDVLVEFEPGAVVDDPPPLIASLQEVLEV